MKFERERERETERVVIILDIYAVWCSRCAFAVHLVVFVCRHEQASADHRSKREKINLQSRSALRQVKPLCRMGMVRQRGPMSKAGDKTDLVKNSWADFPSRWTETAFKAYRLSKVSKLVWQLDGGKRVSVSAPFKADQICFGSRKEHDDTKASRGARWAVRDTFFSLLGAVLVIWGMGVGWGVLKEWVVVRCLWGGGGVSWGSPILRCCCCLKDRIRAVNLMAVEMRALFHATLGTPFRVWSRRGDEKHCQEWLLQLLLSFLFFFCFFKTERTCVCMAWNLVRFVSLARMGAKPPVVAFFVQRGMRVDVPKQQSAQAAISR